MNNTYEIEREVKDERTVQSLYICDGKKIIVKSIFGESPYLNIIREVIKGSVLSQQPT